MACRDTSYRVVDMVHQRKQEDRLLRHVFRLESCTRTKRAQQVGTCEFPLERGRFK